MSRVGQSHRSGWRGGKGGSGWMGEDGEGRRRGGSHTSQGDCELISTLEREREREGGREGGKERK